MHTAHLSTPVLHTCPHTSVAASFIVKEDYLRSNYVDLETVPHTNGEGLIAGFKFRLVGLPIRAGEKIVIVVPHLKPLIDRPVIDLTKYVNQYECHAMNPPFTCAWCSLC